MVHISLRSLRAVRGFCISDHCTDPSVSCHAFEIDQEIGFNIRRNDASFIPLGDKRSLSDWTIFSTYSNGLKTNRDVWVYNYSRKALASNMSGMIEKYNFEVDRAIQRFGSSASQSEVEGFVDKDPKKIK